MNTRRTRDTRHRPGSLADRVREASARARFLAKYRNEVHIYRVSMAMPDGEMYTVEQAAKVFQFMVDQGVTDVLDATFTPSYGAGGWGVESGFTMETATPKARELVELVTKFLGVLRQDCAYVTVDGSEAYEIDNDGNVTPITGE